MRHWPSPAPQIRSQPLSEEHWDWQHLEAESHSGAAEVGTAAKPRNSRAKQSRKTFFMRQLSFEVGNEGNSHEYANLRFPSKSGSAQAGGGGWP